MGFIPGYSSHVPIWSDTPYTADRTEPTTNDTTRQTSRETEKKNRKPKNYEPELSSSTSEKTLQLSQGGLQLEYSLSPSNNNPSKAVWCTEYEAI